MTDQDDPAAPGDELGALPRGLGMSPELLLQMQEAARERPFLTHDFLAQLPQEPLTADTIAGRYAALGDLARGAADDAFAIAGDPTAALSPRRGAIVDYADGPGTSRDPTGRVPRLPAPGPTASEELATQVTRVAGVVGSMARTTEALVGIGREATEGIQGVKGTLEASTAAAEKAAGRLERLTWVLMFLTFVIAAAAITSVALAIWGPRP